MGWVIYVIFAVIQEVRFFVNVQFPYLTTNAVFMIEELAKTNIPVRI